MTHPLRPVFCRRYSAGMSTSQTVNRRRASEIIGVSCGTLRNWACANPPRGPAPIRLGTSQQARAMYSLDEIERWKADPVGYKPPRPSPRRRLKNERHR